MRVIKAVALCVLGLFVAGCAMEDGVTRNETLELPLLSTGEVIGQAEVVLPSYTVRNVNVIVPDTLTVSEANSIKPRADIVWRGDVGIDRYEQLRVLFEESAAMGAEQLQGEVPVNVQIELARFHGMTQHSRYAYRGDYDIEFTLLVTDARSGAVIEGPSLIERALISTPDIAVAMDSNGVTEREYVQDYLVSMLSEVLTH